MANKINLVLIFALTLGFTYTNQKVSNFRKIRQDLKGVNFETLKFNTVRGPRLLPLEQYPYWSSQCYEGSIWGVVLVDITGDAYPEVVTLYEQGYIYIYHNDHGVIESTPSWQSSDWDYNIWAAFGDYDNDGDLDMAVASYSFFGGRVKVYRNDNGTLTTSPIWTAQADGGCWCDWGDVDNDGDLDLASVDITGYPCVFKNNAGMLETIPSWRAFDYNYGVGGFWIDVDNDGDLDLATSGFYMEPPARLYYNNNGNLEQVASWTSILDQSEYSGGYLWAGDINKDGWLDLASAMGYFAGWHNNPNCVYINRGGLLERSPSWFSNDLGPGLGCILGDINGDGWLDLAVNRDTLYGVAYENIQGFLNPSCGWVSGEVPGGLGIDLGDVDQDGIIYKEDTITADGTKKLFYLSTIPVQKITGITIDGDSVPLAGYCCNLKSGWVSFRDSIPSGSQVIFKYYYSIDMELLLSDYNNSNAHLFKNNVGISEQVSKSMGIGLQVYPNPFRNAVSIKFQIPEQGVASSQKSVVSIKIYDANGRLVRQFNHLTNYLFNQIVWDGTDDSGRRLPAGIYFIRVESDEFKETEKVILLR